MIHALSTHLFVNHRLTTSALDRAWESGIPLLEIFCARQHIDYRNQAQINELGHWFRDSKMKMHSLHSPMFSDDCWGRTGPTSVINIVDTDKMRRKSSVEEVKRALEISETVPFRFLIQHVGVAGEEFSEHKLEAAFSSLEELNLFARQRGVDILLENTPNRLSNAENLLVLLSETHLTNNFCFDIGHAHMMEGVAVAFERMKPRIRSTHIHDNNGVDDVHLFPLRSTGGTIDWSKAMELLRTIPPPCPLVLELREVPDMESPLAVVQEVFEKLESL